MATGQGALRVEVLQIMQKGRRSSNYVSLVDAPVGVGAGSAMHGAGGRHFFGPTLTAETKLLLTLSSYISVRPCGCTAGNSTIRNFGQSIRDWHRYGLMITNGKVMAVAMIAGGLMFNLTIR